jgi:hypothetical protein
MGYPERAERDDHDRAETPEAACRIQTGTVASSGGIPNTLTRSVSQARTEVERNMIPKTCECGTKLLLFWEASAAETWEESPGYAIAIMKGSRATCKRCGAVYYLEYLREAEREGYLYERIKAQLLKAEQESHRV